MRRKFQTRGSRDENIIFVVDDDSFVCTLVGNALMPYGRIQEYKEADLMLDEYKENMPDMVFLDINLGKHNGIKVLDSILKIDPEACVCMLSADSTINNIMDCAEFGAVDFLCKPFSKGKLIKALNKSPTINQTCA